MTLPRGPNPGVEWNYGKYAHLYEVVQTLDGYEVHHQGEHRAGPFNTHDAARELSRWLPDPARYFQKVEDPPTPTEEDDDDPGF